MMSVVKRTVTACYWGLGFLTYSCATLASVEAINFKATSIAAERLSRELLIADTHIDVPFRLEMA